MPIQKYTEITNAVYNILDFFPEEEPLKNKTKEKALEIMKSLVKEDIADQVLKDIEVLKSYLSLGKAQGWIDNLNLLILFKEYDKIKEEITASADSPWLSQGHKISQGHKKEGINSEEKLSDRQQEILKVLKTQEKAQVADFKKVLPNVTKRTLRRDLDDLLKKERVVRVGEWNQVFYQINQKVDGTALMS